MEKCCNCGQELTEENIRRAREESGLSPADLLLCCPAYDPLTDECPPWEWEYGQMAANWTEKID